MSTHCSNAIARARPALMVLYFLLGGAPAQAHAVFLSSAPAAGARIERAPATVTLTFGEAVETSIGSIRVFDAGGAVHSSGPVVHPGGRADQVGVVLRGMASGRYVVAWQVVSADSHVVSGAYAFGVGVPAGDPPAVPEENGATLFLPILHFVILAAALLAVGLPIGAATIASGLRDAPSFVEFGAWIVLAFAAFTDLTFRTDLAGGTLTAAVSTRIGILRLITTGAALAGLVSVTGRRRRRPLLVIAGLVTIVSLSLAGHAADGGTAIVGVGADSLHLAAAAGWIGMLAIGTTLDDAPELRRISPVAAAAVVAIVISGVVQTVRNAGSFGALVTTAYGEIIDLKIVLLVVLMLVALSARRILARGSLAIAALIRAELWILTLIIACTAVLVESPLPRDAAPLRSVGMSLRVRDIGVRVTATAIDDRRWNVRVDADGPLDEADVAAEEDRRHVGPLTVPLTRSAPGTFSGTLTLPFAGEWHLLTSARHGAFDEAHRTLDLPEIAP